MPQAGVGSLIARQSCARPFHGRCYHQQSSWFSAAPYCGAENHCLLCPVVPSCFQLKPMVYGQMVNGQRLMVNGIMRCSVASATAPLPTWIMLFYSCSKLFPIKTNGQNAIKRAQSRTCSSYAEREHFRRSQCSIVNVQWNNVVPASPHQHGSSFQESPVWSVLFWEFRFRYPFSRWQLP